MGSTACPKRWSGSGWRTTGPSCCRRARAPGCRGRRSSRRLASSDLLLNVMGYLDDEELLAAPPLRVFLDIDPGFGQMWRQLGLADLLAGHDRFVSVGLNVGSAGCAVPDCGLDWIPTLPPVALDHWPVVPDGTRFTSVATWRGPYGPVEHEGRTYGLRVHEFRRFLSLPGLTPGEFEIALAIDPADAADAERLATGGLDAARPGGRRLQSRGLSSLHPGLGGGADGGQRHLR